MTASIETFRAALPHDIALSCRAAGPRGAPVLLFLHGFPQGAFIWDELMTRFATHFRCVAPNLRGYADSSAPPEVPAYRSKPLVQDLAALIEQLGAPVAATVAHDWGGAAAWTLGVQRPELLARLVILNSPHPGAFLRELQGSAAQQAASAYMNFLVRPDAEALLAQDDYARMWPFFEQIGAAPGRAGWLTPAVKERHREVWRRGLTGPLNYYRASPLRPPTPGDPGARDIRLDPAQVTVRVPTTVVWGEADRALLPGLLDGLEQWVPQLTLVRVPDAGHWIVHEQPQRVAQEIEDALAR
jgi:pimeloyl-ACP methyl ester carboxylesterase